MTPRQESSIRKAVESGFTLRRVAADFGVSIERVREVLGRPARKKSAPPNEPISMQPLDELGIEAAREYAQLDRYQQWDRQAGRRVRTASDHLRIVKGNF